MSGSTPEVAAAGPEAPRRGRPPAPVVVLLQAVGILALLAGTGALGGVLWAHLWDPPTGQVQDGVWGVFSEAGLRTDFAGVALYVLIALGGGLLTGVLTALVLDRSELVSLVVLLGAAAVAGWVMWQVGLHRSPPDPRPLAAGLPDGTRLPGTLRLHSRTPFVSFPIGALVGFGLTLVAVTKHGARSTDGPRATPSRRGKAGTPDPLGTAPAAGTAPLASPGEPASRRAFQGPGAG